MKTSEEKQAIPKVKNGKKFTQTRVFNFFWNRYFIFGSAFIVWMFFFDQNSYFVHRELDKQINNLERDEAYYQENLQQETEKLNQLTENPAEIERIAREKHFLKKENEDIFIVIEEKIEKEEPKKDE